MWSFPPIWRALIGWHASARGHVLVSLVKAAYLSVTGRARGAFYVHDRLHDSHPLGGLHSQIKLGAWCNELSLESNAPLRDYLLRGILRGFDIVDVDATVLPYNCANTPHNTPVQPLPGAPQII